MERKYDINGSTILTLKKDYCTMICLLLKGEIDTLSNFAEFLEITTENFIEDFERLSEFFEIVNTNVEVKKKYSSVIADIYAEHHVSPFTDIEKHNEGIIKAMVDFAIFYKENS